MGRMARFAPLTLAAAIGGAALAAPAPAAAAPPWIYRPMTLPQLVFAGDAGIGIGHARLPPPFGDVTGPGLNLEGAFGITDRVEVGLRTGLRLGNQARAVQADAYGRTLWTETYGTGTDTMANPEARVRWTAYRGDVAEIGLDGRLYLPFETSTRAGMMLGVPLAFHAGNVLRIDTGLYIPVVFNPNTFNGIVVPGYFWFQPSDAVWLGPMVSLRSIDPGPGDRRTDLLLGFGLGIQVASSVDLKMMAFFPRINDDQPTRFLGAGFGVQFRIGE
jgi:hypothetical protein